jgi:hypothetical protein
VLCISEAEAAGVVVSRGNAMRLYQLSSG